MVSINFNVSHSFAPQREKAKRGEEIREKSAPCQHSKIGAKMKHKKTKRKRQDCDVAKVLETVEKALSTAKRVYRVIEPVVSTFTKRRKIK